MNLLQRDVSVLRGNTRPLICNLACFKVAPSAFRVEDLIRVSCGFEVDNTCPAAAVLSTSSNRNRCHIDDCVVIALTSSFTNLQLRLSRKRFCPIYRGSGCETSQQAHVDVDCIRRPKTGADPGRRSEHRLLSMRNRRHTCNTVR